MMSTNPSVADGNNPAPRSSQNRPQLLEATMRNVPKLKELNYAQWKNTITNSIKRAKLWDYVDGSIEEPPDHDPSGLATYYDEAAAVRNAILGSLEPAAQKYIEEALDPRDTWLALEKKYLTAEAETDSKLVSIEKQLADLRLGEGGDMIEHIAEFCRMRSQLSGTRLAVDDQACISMLYRSLPSAYRQSVLTPEGTEMKEFSALCARLTYLSQNPKPEAPVDEPLRAPVEDYTNWGVPGDILASGLTGDKNPLLEERAAITCRDCLLKGHKAGTPECPQYEWRRELWGAEVDVSTLETNDSGDLSSKRPPLVNAKRVSYEFSEPVKVILGFDELGLKPRLTQTLYTYPNPLAIQQCAILPILKGRNVHIQAPYKNGKTTALAISVLQMVDSGVPCLQALVFTSTNEATIDFQSIIGKLGSGLSIQCSSDAKDIVSLPLVSKHQIFVGTPGDLLGLVRRSIINMRRLRIVALDDIDKLIESGMEDQILETYDPEIKTFRYFYLETPIQHNSVISKFRTGLNTLHSSSSYYFDSGYVYHIALIALDSALSTAAAGLSNIGVPLINYDVPKTTEAYIERLNQWRLADPGQNQMIITFVTEDTEEINVIQDLRRYYGVHVWKNVITNSIKNAKLWEYIDGSIQQPPEENSIDLATYFDEAGAVRNAILGSLESGAQKYIEEALDPRDAWLSLEKKYLTAEAEADAKLASVEKQLSDLRLEEGGDMVEHIAEFCRMRCQLHGSRFALDDPASVKGTEMKGFGALCARLTYLSQNPEPEVPIDDTPPAPTEDYTNWGIPEDIRSFGLTGDKNPLLEERAAVTCRDCLLKDHKAGTPECPQYEWRKELWGMESKDISIGTRNLGKASSSEQPLLVNAKRLCYEFSEPIKVILSFDELGLKSDLRQKFYYSLRSYLGYSSNPITSIGSLSGINEHHIFVGTPENLLALISRKVINLRKLKIVALDDLDKLVEAGMESQILEVYRHVPPLAQVVASSTTYSFSIAKAVTKLLADPLQITVNRDEGLSIGTHFYVTVPVEQKPDALPRFLSTLGMEPADAVTWRTRSGIRTRYEILQTNNGGYANATLITIRTMVATDPAFSAARVDLLNTGNPIVHYDIPNNIEDYVKRLWEWRISDSGRSHLVISFVTTNELHIIQDLE
ncbi:unnamed protein product, partial [Rhizoctonia solani]